MKFGKTLEKALGENDIPEEWKTAAINYKALKKCIKKVSNELSLLGLDASTVKTLDEAQEVIEKHFHLEYSFSGDTKGNFQSHPRIILTLDKTLPETNHLPPRIRESIGELISTNRPDTIAHNDSDSDISADNDPIFDANHLECCSDESDIAKEETLESQILETEKTHITISLKADGEFFDMLKDELELLETLHKQQISILTSSVNSLSRALPVVVVPPETQKSDLYAWREIFQCYLSTQVFVTTNELFSSEKNIELVSKRLEFFLKRVEKLGYPRKFKLSMSKSVLQEFISLNILLLRNLRFQGINRIAMDKILKKFDKRTLLGAKSSFIDNVSHGPFLAVSVSKSVCFTISNSLLSVVPQLDDYTCPICASILMKPVRLECSHTFCLRCLVKLQRAQRDHCPLCRRAVVMSANSRNIDRSLLNFLNFYFPVEAKCKQTENETEVALEQLERLGFAPRTENCAVIYGQGILFHTSIGLLVSRVFYMRFLLSTTSPPIMSPLPRLLKPLIKKRFTSSSAHSNTRKWTFLASCAGVSSVLGLGLFYQAYQNPIGATTMAEEGLHPVHYPWPQSSPLIGFDHKSLRRGFQVYQEACSSCHSLSRIAWRNLVGVTHTVDEAKALAAQVEYEDGPDDNGNMYKRPGKLSDYLPQPFPNEQTARVANGGALPPDLSLIVKARHGGCDYVFSLLTGYVDPPAGVKLGDGLNFNPYFPGTGIAMPRMLYDGLVEYEDGTPSTTSQMAYDVSNFLNWAAEPFMEDSKRRGLKAVVGFAFLFAMSVWLKRFKWIPLKTRKIVYNPPKT